MNKFAMGMVAGLAWLLSMSAWAQEAPFKDGVQYLSLANAQPTLDPNRIEVLELFWYGCPHCYDLESDIKAWKARMPEDVNFVRMPAIPSPRWEWYAKAFFTAEVLGVLDTLHLPIFDAIHKQHRPLKDEQQMAALFAEHGVSEADFKGALNSFAVVTKLNRARQLTRRYGITGVPTLIVNGKYNTSGSMAGSHEKMLEVVDYLVATERAGLKQDTHMQDASGELGADTAALKP